MEARPNIAKAAASNYPAQSVISSFVPASASGLLRQFISTIRGWMGRVLWAQAITLPHSAAQDPSDIFCINPFVQLLLWPTGTVKPCCVFAEELRTGDRAMSIYEHTVDDIWNSESLRDIRRAMVLGHPVTACEYCYQSEKKGLASIRKSAANAYWQAGLDLRRIAAAAPLDDYRIASRPLQLDLRMGNLCNLRCRMCGSHFSSAIESDDIHSRWAPPDAPHSPAKSTCVDIARQPHDGDSILCEMDRSARSIKREWFRRKELLYGDLLRAPHELRFLTLIGGEPLLIPETRDILEHLIRSGAASDIILCLFTNGSIFDEDWLDLAGKFKLLQAQVSIDGRGALNDYIRFPSRWHAIAENLLLLKARPNVQLRIHTTVQAYNMLHVSDIAHYCDELKIDLQYHSLEHPPHLDSFAMPPPVRLEAARRLRAYISEGGRQLQEPLRRLASAWEAPRATDPAMLTEFMVFTNDLDTARGQNFAVAVPELKILLERSGFKWSQQRRHTRADCKISPPTSHDNDCQA